MSPLRFAPVALLLGCSDPEYVAETDPPEAERFTYQVRVAGDLVAVGGVATLEALCDPGDQVIGGGCQVAGTIAGTYPRAERAGWICYSHDSGEAIVYAICEAER